MPACSWFTPTITLKWLFPSSFLGVVRVTDFGPSTLLSLSYVIPVPELGNVPSRSLSQISSNSPVPLRSTWSTYRMREVQATLERSRLSSALRSISALFRRALQREKIEPEEARLRSVEQQIIELRVSVLVQADDLTIQDNTFSQRDRASDIPCEVFEPSN